MTPEVPHGPALADGQWHRLHPATPLLKGGIWFLAVLGFLLANFRERLIETFLPDEPGRPEGGPPDIIGVLYTRGQLGIAIALVAGVLLVAVAAFWLSWWMHTFRITEDAVQVRSGILFRTRRDARLDRVQGIAVQRPLLARIFGAAKLEISAAGQDAKIQLSYLRSGDVDALRRDILTLASGATPRSAASLAEPRDANNADGAGATEPAQGGGSPEAGLLNRRIGELLASELPADVPPESVVHIPPARLAGSLLVSGVTVAVLIGVGVLIGTTIVYGHVLFLFLVIPGAIATVGYYATRFTRSLRFSIASTADGIRVGYGLFSTSSDILPPGRVHAIGVSQPLLWRPFGWWAVRVNRAGHPGSGSQITASLLLPVGTVDDLRRVLALLFPDDEERGVSVAAAIPAALGPGAVAGYTAAPKRSRVILPFSWRRTGVRVLDDLVLIRSGALWRRLVIVPLARMQSAELRTGPVRRMLRLSSLRLHTVTGPVVTVVPALDEGEGASVWEDIASLSVLAARDDVTHRWAQAAGREAGGERAPGDAGDDGREGAGA